MQDIGLIFWLCKGLEVIAVNILLLLIIRDWRNIKDA